MISLNVNPYSVLEDATETKFVIYSKLPDFVIVLSPIAPL